MDRTLRNLQRPGALSLLLPALVIVGCDPFDRELSDREARKALEQVFESPGTSAAALAPNSVESRERSIAIDAGVLEGLWKPLSWREYFASNESATGTLSPQLTEKGEQLFTSVGLTRLSESTLELAQPLTRTVLDVVRVRTAGDEDTRMVDYTYRWNAPDVVLRYIGRDRDVSATATFTRSDEGWDLRELTHGEEFKPFRRDPDAEASGRKARESRCRQSAVTTQPRGTYKFTHHSEPASMESFELAVSDVGFTVTRRFEASGRILQVLTRSHFWGDVLAVNTQPRQVELTVLLGRDRTIGRPWGTYKITIADDGKAVPPLDTATRDITQVWTDWHGRFVDCLPTPTNAWDGK